MKLLPQLMEWPNETCRQLTEQKDWQGLRLELSRLLLDSEETPQTDAIAELLSFLLTQNLKEEEKQKLLRLSQLIFDQYLESNQWTLAVRQWMLWRETSPTADWLQARLRQIARRIGKPRQSKNAPKDDLPVPSPFAQIQARVSLDESFPTEEWRDQWVEQGQDRIPYFSEMNINEAFQILPHLEWRSYKKGETIFEKSSSSEHLYIVARGEVELDNHVGDKRPVLRNEIFGDLTLFGQLPHTASAVAKERTDLLTLSFEQLEPLLSRLPQFKAQVLAESQQRLFRQVQHRSFTLNSFPPEEAEALWDYLIPLHVSPDQTLIAPNREADRFFMILSGRLEVVRPGITSIQLGAGQFVGERGFLLQTSRTAQVKSLSHCHLLECDRLSFEELCDAYPLLRRSISKIIPELEEGRFYSKDPVID